MNIDIPAELPFKTTIPIRITDLNYGGHVGNDTILSLLHEARIQFLRHYGYEELNLEGVGVIMRDVAIQFKKEIFYGDVIKASVGIGDFSRISFELYYRLEKKINGQFVDAVVAKTGMVCYDYVKKKIASVPAQAKSKFQSAPVI